MVQVLLINTWREIAPRAPRNGTNDQQGAVEESELSPLQPVRHPGTDREAGRRDPLSNVSSHTQDCSNRQCSETGSLAGIISQSNLTEVTGGRVRLSKGMLYAMPSLSRYHGQGYIRRHE